MSIEALVEWAFVVVTAIATLGGVALRAVVRRIGAMRRSRAVASRLAVARQAAGRETRS